VSSFLSGQLKAVSQETASSYNSEISGLSASSLDGDITLINQFPLHLSSDDILQPERENSMDTSEEMLTGIGAKILKKGFHSPLPRHLKKCKQVEI